MADNFEKTSATTREFTLKLLEQITNNFSEEHIIGRGGYGVVYKGVLENGEEIALKKLHHMARLDDTQFRNEFNNLMRAQHPNIIQLVGYCYDIGHQRIKHGGEYVFAQVEERILCFEYLQGGSLDKHISDESCGLDWHTRFKIIKGVCDGLNYLHNGCKDPIYHLDLKPANILLDKNMAPKIGDFGLSRLFPSTKTYITIKIIGTPGYMPPEYIERFEITSKYDVFSLGVIIIRIVAGDEGYSKCAQMSSQEFLEHVHENWGKRMHATISSHTSKQVETCIEIALRCVEVDRRKRPTIAEIVDELNKVDTAKSSLTGQVASWNQNSNSERRGRIVSTTRRPPVPFDIFSCPISTSSTDEELSLTDGVFSNYNGRSIPSAALKTLLKRPKLAEEGADADIDAGRVSGLIFVSERDDGLETLYIALRFNVDNRVKVFALADIFGAADFGGMRLEDSGCIGGGYSVGSRTVDHCLIYVSTKEPMQQYRSPWTAMYKTNLSTGKTERLTPQGRGVFDLSPAVSPSGRMVAVASSEGKTWNGEMKNVETDIYLMNVDSEEGQGQGRKLLINNGGWPSWGSDDMIFFHRWGVIERAWGVLRYKISTGQTFRVTPPPDAMTPAAISETKVAVETICGHYRHIEIIDTDDPWLQRVRIDITHKLTPNVHHYSPFVLDGGCRIGYHRCRSESDLVPHGDHVPRILHRLESPMKDVGLFRVSSMFPTISKDGSKLAFVDNKLKVWVADNQGLRMVHELRGSNRVFSSPVWNQNPDKDILYVCIGSSSDAQMPVEIYAIHNASGDAVQRQVRRLTYGGFNNAFPSSSPDGKKLVFQSTRDFVPERGSSQPTSNWQKLMVWRTRRIDARKKHKNLYIMLKTDVRGSQEGWVTRLTKGPWTDTQCQWSPSGDWIAFSSTRDKPARAADLDDSLLLDPGYLSVFLVKAQDPTVVIKLITRFGGHVEYPVFSPDGRSIAVTMALVAVSAEPVSLPMSTGTARPYRGIFTVDIGPHDKKMKSKDVEHCRRITHSRYECSMLAWTSVPTDPDAQWNIMLAKMEAQNNGRQAATSSSHGGHSGLSLIYKLLL